MSDQFIFDLRFESVQAAFLLQPLVPAPDFGFVPIGECFQMEKRYFAAHAFFWISKYNGVQLTEYLMAESKGSVRVRSSQPLRARGDAVSFSRLSSGWVRMLPIRKGKRGTRGDIDEAEYINPEENPVLLWRRLTEVFKKLDVVLPSEP